MQSTEFAFLNRTAPQLAATSDDEMLACSGAKRLLLIDHRDEVAARLFADLRGFGFIVERATTVAEAVNRCRRDKITLVLCYRDLPEESGWLVASKLRLLDPALCIWLYASVFKPFDQIGAEHSGIEDLVYDEGDLLRLSTQLIARLHRRGIRMRNCADRVLQDKDTQIDSHQVLLRTLHPFRSVA